MDRSPKGELGFYLINKRRQSESLSLPCAPAQFYQSAILEDLYLGHTVADVMVILGSVDIVMGEVDR
jgi:NADH-quinone oxidoreductase subunit D